MHLSVIDSNVVIPSHPIRETMFTKDQNQYTLWLDAPLQRSLRPGADIKFLLI